ncbi:MAG TPA: hypothetical protein VHE35_06310 [Kofleriaceae bacterium]|nr:hypothetical protein [Kofleriaceae bacterium]
MRIALAFALAAPAALAALAALAAAACGGYGAGSSSGPKTAAERNAADREANPEQPVDNAGKSWGGWRYQGSRDDCFFVVERKCFATLADACGAASCKHGCTTTGAGPATVLCK